MKTVMKKMFSLLLVAVLLVGVMPMAAHADECEHTPAGSYMYDANQHWQICSTCQNWVGYTAHSGGEATCKNQAVCTVCGQAYGATNATNHKNTTVKDASAATCKNPGHEGNTWCLDCNQAIATGKVIPATGNHVAADNTYGKDANQHWQVCSCGEYFGYTAHSWNAATCTTAKTCSVCGQTEGPAPSHTPGPAATCTTAQICTTCGTELEAAKDHSYGTDGKCTRTGCTASETSTHEVYFSVNGNQNFWHLGVEHNHTVANPGHTYGTNYHFLEQVADTDTQKFMGWSKNPSATTGSELEYIVQMPVKESVTYYAIYQAKQPSSDSSNSGSTGSGSSGSTGSNDNNSSNTNIPSGSHSLKIYARIWVHETKFETRLLDTISNLSSSAKIYQVIAANKDHLNAILPYDEFQYLHWGETVNYLNDDNEYEDVGTSLTVGDENEVFINLYSAEQLIVVNVHTSKSWSYDLSVRIEGFRPGDTVTYDDVLKAVKKYYNVSRMTIYTYEEMCKMLEGKEADETKAFIAGAQVDPYEVFISGSRKSGAYKYTADPSNPKTGDEIFVPMAVLGLSASALAVMFYLNKKRAY